ncbi:hypothetical protein [Flavobacterium aurantiibacter]|uniref:Uncharacterized protein n=1 Tax=Flavobacterium aurantiibacter TaxID=2023067 RepID=A0A256A9L9_9FLAO|nr:hypothetical protein [Flavobacterium aurantiibacter]OYQ50397.1 hypothetical protein CHX27_00870 [Flavobacterium aurantiibacter]
MERRVHYAIVFIFLILYSCECRKIKLKNVSSKSVLIADTIQVKTDKNHSLDSCQLLNQKFYKNSGIVISEFYNALDSLRINDSISILVISPISLERPDLPCSLSNEFGRTILEINRVNKKINRSNVNLISQNGGVLNKFVGLSPLSNGYEIVHESGNLYAWKYTVSVNYLANKLIITRITKICSFDTLSQTVIYNKDLDLAAISIQDSLDKNCNCDPIWRKLESNKK